MSTQVFQAKTKEELSSMDITELVSYVASVTAQVEHKDDEHKQTAKKAMDEHEKEKQAMEDEKKEAVKAMEDEKKEHEAVLASVLKAMDEKDPEKREAMIKSAMDDHEKQKEGKKASSHEDDEEKKALKAEVTYLASKFNKDTIDYLTKVYKAANTPDETIQEYVAEWKSMSTRQLDGAVEKIKPLVEQMGEQPYQAETKKPFGFSGGFVPSKVESFSASKSYKKIDELTPEQAFSGHGGIA